MLTLIATPIGNLKDISYRAVEALQEADAVFCEDTRHSLLLLNHLQIKKPLVSCHEHNERARAEEMAALLKSGKNIAYISDAGMPGISDPGSILVETCIREGLEYTVIPGASAVLTAAVLSGYPCARFSFFGFLPRDNKERKEVLEELKLCRHMAILYESPHRVGTTLQLLKEEFGGDCRAALMRELTKKFETADRGTLEELCERYREAEPKGECVLVLCCQDRKEENKEVDLDAEITEKLKEGLSVKDVAAVISEKYGMAKKNIYRRALEIKGDSNEEM